MLHDMKKPLPHVQPWSAAFWDRTRQGKLLIQHCRSCDRYIFRPRKYCPHCWSDAIDWKTASGFGRIHSFTTAYAMVEPPFAPDLPYTIGFIDLDEGVRMMSRIVETDLARIDFGKRVEVVFEEREDFFLPNFKVVD